MSKQKENNWLNYGVRILVNTASHPVDYAKVLIQLGYEPIPPKPTTTFFGKPALKLPNIFQYVKHIKSVDGITGCYRGVVPKVCGNLVGALVSQKVLDSLNETEETSEEEVVEETPETRKQEFVKNLKYSFINRVTTIIVSHPFHVITIRMMAQFVGGETQYSGLFASIGEIYSQNGILGFFSGLIPRILGDVISLILTSTLTYLVNTYIIEERELQIYSQATMSFIATTATYPFQVVSNCMAVTNSGLRAGSPPHMPIYNSWIDCWTDLSRRNQIKRGASLLVRYYTGPQVVVAGRLVPLPHDVTKIN